MSDEKKTTAEVLAEKILSGTADLEAAKHIAERTGHPALLNAFRALGYRVEHRINPLSSPPEVERQKRFGEAARRLAESPVNATPDPKTFEERYIHRVFKRADGGDIKAIDEFVELAEGAAEWRIDKKDE